MTNSKPVVGAATMISVLEQDDALRRFILERDRDLEIQDFLSPEVLRGTWRDDVQRARKILNGHNGRIGVHGPFISFTLDAADPDIRKIAVQRLNTCVEACAALSGPDRQPHLVVHSPFTTWHCHNLDTRPGAREHLYQRAQSTLGEAVTLAEREGVVIVIENIEDRDPHERHLLAQSFNSAAVQVSIDTGHAFYAHKSTGAPPVDVFVRAAGNALAHVHLQDGDGYADRHWQIGEGDIPWPEVFRAIGELSHRPRLVLEMKTPEDILPSARWLIDQELCE